MQNAVVIQDCSSERQQWLIFSQPEQVLSATELTEVEDCLQQIDAAANRGLYAVGFISYEAGAALDPALVGHQLQVFPYLWFGLYGQCEVVEDIFTIESGEYEIGHWQQSVAAAQYDKTFAAIHQHIRDGDSYQINYTYKLHANFTGDAWSLFKSLYQAQKPHYAAYLDIGRFQILSVSPELFFSLDDGRIISKPMKGTVNRGVNQQHDTQLANWLRQSNKNQAENLMIVDMIRNDLGKVAETGSVNVDSLFQVERYPTVQQMVSTVSAQANAPFSSILTALFPCASVTGAPKAKAMQIIKELESVPRGVYTGAIGYIKPNKQMQFNVAIRTVVLDKEQQSAEYGVGGGIVWDSQAATEYQECHAKAAVLHKHVTDFSLLESLVWHPEKGYFLLDYHLQRIQHAARYFIFNIDLELIRQRLLSLAESLSSPQKVIVTVTSHGNIDLLTQSLQSVSNKTVLLDDELSDTQSPFYYYKTTNRAHYQQALKRHESATDVILLNKQRHVTESTVANIVIERNGELLTPDLNGGLLDGTFRRLLLEQQIIKEAKISVQNLMEASQLYLINSVRGWVPLQQKSEGCWQTAEAQGFELRRS